MFGIKLPFRRQARTPEEVEAKISAKAARKAARLAAKGKAASLLEDAREGYRPKSLAVRTVQWSGYILFIAALVIIAAGYWYDILFYGQQADEWYIVAGLVAFAFVIRSLAAFGDVLLHWTKPKKPGEEDDDEGLEGLKSLVRTHVKGDSDRAWLRALWIASIVACSFATVSFFSAGHETRQADQKALQNTENTVVASQADRVAAINAQKAEAKEARDTAISAADETIQGVRDETPNVSAEDNVTIRDANASKNQANQTYTETLNNLNAQINDIYAETGEKRQETQEQKNGTPPFQTVYSFLARLPFLNSAEGWAIAGAWFFAILFELLIAKLLAIVSVLNKALKRIAKGLQMREAADEMHARIALERMKSNIDIEAIRLKGAQASEKAAADIVLAKQEREVEKAKAHAEALREGVPWVDPDELLTQMAEVKKAENAARVRKMQERIEKLEAGELDPDEQSPENDNRPEVDPNSPMTPEEKGAKGGAATAAGNAAEDATVIEISPTLTTDQQGDAA